MTDTQRKQFMEKGCLSRCVIKLLEIHDKPKTIEEYCKECERWFPNPEEEYGGLTTCRFIVIAHHLKLADFVQSYRCYDEITNEKNKNKRDVIICSEVNLSKGKTDDKFHASLLQSIDEFGFALWSPSQNGKDGEPKFTKAEWDEKCCHGLSLIKV